MLDSNTVRDKKWTIDNLNLKIGDLDVILKALQKNFERETNPKAKLSIEKTMVYYEGEKIKYEKVLRNTVQQLLPILENEEHTSLRK